MGKLAVIAVGGNSLIKDDKNVTVEDQQEALRETAHHIADMIEAGWDLAIGHGNGPQVGFILRRSEIAAKVEGMHEVPLDVCGADSQGAIGYEFQQALQNEYHKRGIQKGAATVITQTLVDQKDAAFQKPSKPIGSFMDEAEAKEEFWILSVRRRIRCRRIPLLRPLASRLRSSRASVIASRALPYGSSSARSGAETRCG